MRVPAILSSVLALATLASSLPSFTTTEHNVKVSNAPRSKSLIGLPNAIDVVQVFLFYFS